MSDTNQALSGIEQVPWARIVHFYGRATEVPGWIRGLASGDHAVASAKLRNCLEHQDGVIQAAPFAAWFIVRMLNGGMLRDPDGVRAMLRCFQAASRWQMDCDETIIKPLGWNELLAEGRLWPEFVGEREDEILWDEWDPDLDEQVSWAILTNQFIDQLSS